MSERIEIHGVRGHVVAGEVAGGWAWHCHTCGSRAGMASGKRRPNGEAFAPDADPFIDKEINGRWDTARGHCVRSATAHAERVCAGQKTRDWQPPNWTEPVEK